MFGWRARIGIVVPAANTTMELEFYKMAPEGVSIHTARMRGEYFREMSKDALKAAEDLALAKVDVIVYGCDEPEWEENFKIPTEKKTNLPVVTVAGATLDALEAVKARNLTVVTPYNELENQKVKAFLENYGFKILNMIGLGLTKTIEVGKLNLRAGYTLAKKAFVPKSDTILIACTNFNSLEIIDLLEKDLMITVLTSNQASMWKALKKVRIKEKMSKFGKLMIEHL